MSIFLLAKLHCRLAKIADFLFSTLSRIKQFQDGFDSYLLERLSSRAGTSY
jgi:hypothetical protein